MTPPESLVVAGADGTALQVLRWPATGGTGTGEDAPFLLVHGLASNARLWDGVAAGLAQRGHRAAAVDLRGHGESAKPDAGYDFDTMTADLAAVIASFDGPRPVVAGQSWGGNVVAELAARRPELVRGIVCVDGGWIDLSRFRSWEECERALAPPRTTGMSQHSIESMLRGRHPDWSETGIRGAMACYEVRPDGTVAPRLTRDRHLRILRSLWEQRVTEVFPSVKVPALLVPCDDGTQWSERKRAEVAAAETGLPCSRTVWFEAHHDIHAQRPQALVDAMLEALSDGFFG